MKKPTFLDTDLEQKTEWGFVFPDPPKITRNGCSSLTETDKRFRFYMYYGDDKDCYAEITFSSKTKLTLTVSNFKVCVTFRNNPQLLLW